MKLHMAFIESWRARAPGMPLIAECAKQPSHPGVPVDARTSADDDRLPDDLMASCMKGAGVNVLCLCHDSVQCDHPPPLRQTP